MKTLISIISIIITCALSASSQNKHRADSFDLQASDLFIISEYKEIQYEAFSDGGGSRLPANLSAFNFYVDISGKTTYSNVVDVNYLYLRDYSTHESGEVVYLITKKNKPTADRKTNIQSAKHVDQYSDISCIDDLSFGYWQKHGDRITIVFRESTTIKSMREMRVFTGFIIEKNIYLTRGMNSKDEYLFDYKFRRNKLVEIKLPLKLETIFYTDSVENKAENEMVQKYIEKNKSLNYNSTEGPSLRKKQKADNLLEVSIKYWCFNSNKKDFQKRDFYVIDSEKITFEMVKKGKYGKKKYALLSHSKSGITVYSRFKIKQYTNYFERWHQEENISISVTDPYNESIKHVFQVPRAD